MRKYLNQSFFFSFSPIIALAAGNAHLQHYFNTELTYLLDILEDNTIDNCKGKSG